MGRKRKYHTEKERREAQRKWQMEHYLRNKEKIKDSRAPQAHYGCMSIDDIYKLPVQDISADDCICFMWVTYPLLKEGIKTMEEWGFTYKTCAFSWIKTNRKSGGLFWGLG